MFCTGSAFNAKISGGEIEDFALALGCVEPQEWQIGKIAFKNLAILADLADDAAFGIEMVRCGQQNAAHQIKPIATTIQRHRRLSRKFGRQFAHHFIADIGRIGDDEIIAALLQRLEQITLMQADALRHAMHLKIDCGDFERGG